jgi:hypothetical protein
MNLDDENSMLQSGNTERPPEQAATVGAIHLTLWNRSGSVQHYYHFLFGFLVPIVRNWTILASVPESGEVLVRSCAIMDPLLRQLRLPGLSIIDAAAHAAMRRKGTAEALQFFDFQGYDDPMLFDKAVFQSVRDQLLFRFDDEVRAEQRNLVSSFPGSGPRIVIIQRLPGDPFYATEASERKTSGTERRSIANIDELYASVRRDGGNAILTTLENRSLYYRMALFALADVVVGQIGAGLSNLLWARQGTRVIEIMPEEFRWRFNDRYLFSDLARCLSFGYEVIWQESSHGAVDPMGVVAAVRRATARIAPPFSALQPFCVRTDTTLLARLLPIRRRRRFAWRLLRRFVTWR